MQKRRMGAGEWFGMADQFSAAAHIIVQHSNSAGKHFIFPQVACRAFAAEAYLKCLLTLRSKHFPPDHNLRTLFRILPAEDRAIIEEWWNAETLPNVLRAGQNPTTFPVPSTFEQCLKRSAEAFKEWRYNTKETRYWWLGGFPNNVRRRILDMKPDWVISPPGPLPDNPKS